MRPNHIRRNLRSRLTWRRYGRFEVTRNNADGGFAMIYELRSRPYVCRFYYLER